ncbi:MAG: hypothetical protein AB8G05_08740 [Oligoflexales bacterium]
MTEEKEEKEDSNIARLLTPKKEAKKRQYSFYLNEKLYKAFMDTCKKRDISGSRVISAYMKDFLEKYGD